jgi:hypothetical protein
MKRNADMAGRIITNEAGQNLHVGGCLRPPAGHPRAFFARFMTPEFPVIPEVYDLTAAAEEPLGQMWGNDKNGDCVPVMIFRNSSVKLCNAENYSNPYTTDDVLGFYSRNTGFVQGDPSTDQGSDPVSALQYAQTSGLLPDGSHKIAGFLTVNGKVPLEVRRSIWLFGGVMATSGLPDVFVRNLPSASGFIFDVCGPSDPNNGHGFFFAPKYKPGAVDMSTWAMQGWMTDDAVAQYCDGNAGAIYIGITQDMLNKAKAKTPNGFDWVGVENYFQAMQREMAYTPPATQLIGKKAS